MWGILFILSVLSFASCTKQDATTYSITNDNTFSFTAFIDECNADGEAINVVNEIFGIETKRVFTASENAVKLKIYIDDMDKWVQQVFYLNIGGHLDIVINGKTIVGPQKP